MTRDLLVAHRVFDEKANPEGVELLSDDAPACAPAVARPPPPGPEDVCACRGGGGCKRSSGSGAEDDGCPCKRARLSG